MLQKPDICLTCPVPPLSLTSVKPPARCQPCRRTGFPSMVILPRQRARPAERRPPTLPKPICSRQDAFFRKARRCQVLLACLQPIGLKAAPNLKPPRALQPRAPGGCGDIAASPSCPCLAFIGALAGLHNWCAGRPAAQTSVSFGPKSSSTQTKLSEHETNRGEAEKSERVLGEIFEILGQPAAAIKPSESAFDNPTSRQKLEPFCLIGAFDDFDVQMRQDFG